jgi:tetratricopeptide (TPR) repeat protein
VIIRNNLARAYIEAGNLPRAIELLEQARLAEVKRPGVDQPNLLLTLHNLGQAYSLARKFPQAMELLEQVHEAEVKKLGPDHPDALLVLHNLGLAYLRAGKLPDAIQRLESLLEARAKNPGSDAPASLATLEDLARAYRLSGRDAEARSLSAKYLDARIKMLPAEIPASAWQQLRQRGDLYARGAQWPRAAADYEAARKAHPEDHDLWYHCAPLWLEAGDRDAYRRHCREMLRHFGATADPVLAERTAKVCLLEPDPGDDLTPALKLAEWASTGTEKHSYYPYFLLASGLAHYRAGAFDRALERLKQCVKPEPSAWNLAVPAYLVLAMAQERLGHADEAGKALARARAIMADKEFPRSQAGDLVNWHDWIICQLLDDEAVALLGAPK